MTDIKKTQVAIRSDNSVGVSSTAHGANIDAVAFNLDLIAAKRPTEAVEILDLFSELKDITPETPVQPDEDFGLASERIRKTLGNLDD
jgi:hypothetical protein